MMDFLVQELTKNGTISTAQEAQLIEILSTQRVPGLAEGGPDSPIPHLFNCQDFIDSVLSDLIQVSYTHCIDNHLNVSQIVFCLALC